MSELELILREIDDKWTRENFSRLLRYVKDQAILQGEWEIYEIRFDGPSTNFKFKHNLDFVPQDIIQLQVIGDRNVEFNHDKFDGDYIDITVAGPCYLRFLAGRYPDQNLSPTARQGLTNVSIGGGSSPGARKGEWVLLQGTIPALTSSVVIDSFALADFDSMTYKMSFQGATQADVRSLNMDVLQLSGSITERVSGKLGPLKINLNTNISGSSFELLATNTYGFDVDYCLSVLTL